MKTRFFTVEQAAQILKTNINTVRAYCREGKIPAMKIGRSYRIAEADLERWCEKQRGGETSLREEEQRLIEAEAKYRNLFESSSDAVVLFDTKGCLMLANRRFYELSGYSTEQAEGLHFTRLFYPEDLSLVTERFMLKMVGEGIQSSHEARFVRKDGQVIPVEVDSARFMKEGKLSGVQTIFRDISERQRAEIALKESEARYRAVVEDQSELICRWLPNGDLTFVNKAYCRFFGKTHEELLGHGFMPLIPDEDHEKVKKHFALLSVKSPVATHEHRVITANGEIRWVQWTNRLISDEQGKTIGFQSVGRDVTDRRTAEEMLKESEEIYRMLVKASPDAVTATDLEGNITYVSERAVQMHGCRSAKELHGKAALELIAPEDRERAAANMQKTLKEGFVENAQYTLLRAGGTCFIGELNAALIKDVEGKPRAFIATVRDITERKRIEEEREKLIKAVGASSDGIAVLDENQRLLFINQAFARIHGYDSEELVGKDWRNLVPEAHLEKVKAEVGAALRARGEWEGPFEAVRKDSKKVWVSLSITVLRDSSGKPAGFINVLREFLK